jgi:hypothetical protein
MPSAAEAIGDISLDVVERQRRGFSWRINIAWVVTSLVLYEVVVLHGLSPEAAEGLSELRALPLDGRAPLLLFVVGMVVLAWAVTPVAATYGLGSHALVLRGPSTGIGPQRKLPEPIVIPYTAITEIRRMRWPAGKGDGGGRRPSDIYSGKPFRPLEVQVLDLEHGRDSIYRFAPSKSFRRELRERWEWSQRQTSRARPPRPS